MNPVAAGCKTFKSRIQIPLEAQLCVPEVSCCPPAQPQIQTRLSGISDKLRNSRPLQTLRKQQRTYPSHEAGSTILKNSGANYNYFNPWKTKVQVSVTSRRSRLVRLGVEPRLVIVTRSLAWGAHSEESASPPFVVSQHLCRSHIFTHVHPVALHSCSQCLQPCKTYCIYSSYLSRPYTRTVARALRYWAFAMTSGETLLQVVS
jgi:hypothetical protein